MLCVLSIGISASEHLNFETRFYRNFMNENERGFWGILSFSIKARPGRKRLLCHPGGHFMELEKKLWFSAPSDRNFMQDGGTQATQLDIMGVFLRVLNVCL